MSTEDEATDHDNKRDNQSAFLTLGERRLGTFMSAFYFPVNVHHDGVAAKLAAGVLRVAVPKLFEGAKLGKVVSVQIAEAIESVEA